MCLCFIFCAYEDVMYYYELIYLSIKMLQHILEITEFIRDAKSLFISI